jgi:hypothetical protein
VTDRNWLPMSGVLLLVAVEASGQGAVTAPAQAAAFMGTWVIELTEEMRATQTINVWERNGVVAASVGNPPAIDVTGIVSDGNMLVLTVSRDGARPVLENGVPIWAVYVLTLDGDTMKVALVLEQSRTVKRGIGKKIQP